MNPCSGRSLLLAGLLLLPSGSPLTAQTGSDTYGPRPATGERAAKLHAANLAKYGAAPDMLVLPGLVANRKTKRIELLAESTGLAGNSTVEFLVVDQSSSHGYEALLWSLAKPSDIHAALVFVGMRPGAAFDPGQLRFWPKGERVNISVAATNGAAPLRIENLILDKRADKPLPEDGFLFTGSSRRAAPTGGAGVVYGADAYDPKSVVSLYNEPGTVMDVPRKANQSEVYDTQVANPEHVHAAGKLLTLILEPERKEGEGRVRDLVLDIGPAPRPPDAGDPGFGTNGAGRPVRCLLKDSAGKALGKDPTLEGAVTALAGLMRQGFDPYLAVRFDGALTLAEVRRTCAVVGMLEAGSGLKIEPPSEGQLYYKAFTPDERWRDPAGRIAQPWEVHLAGENAPVSGRLVRHEEIWTDGNPEPKLEVLSFDVATPKALRERLDADAEQRNRDNKRPSLTVLLVFAEAGLPYGELVRFIGPALTTHNTVHVFLKTTARKGEGRIDDR